MPFAKKVAPDEADAMPSKFPLKKGSKMAPKKGAKKMPPHKGKKAAA